MRDAPPDDDSDYDERPGRSVDSLREIARPFSPVLPAESWTLSLPESLGSTIRVRCGDRTVAEVYDAKTANRIRAVPEMIALLQECFGFLAGHHVYSDTRLTLDMRALLKEMGYPDTDHRPHRDH